MPLENKQIEAMAAWTLEDFQDDPLAAIEQVRELAAAHLSLQRERDAAVRDIEKIMSWDDTSVFCQFCKKDEVCDLNYTDCDPEWRGPHPEQVLAPADQSAMEYADNPVLAQA